MECVARNSSRTAVWKQLLGSMGVLLAFGANAGPTVTEFTFQSESGDVVGGGLSGTFAGPTTTIDVAAFSEERPLIGGVYSGVTVTVTTPTGTWRVDLVAPRGETLRPGRFFGADELTSGHSPGLHVAVDDKSCTQVWGGFVVDQIATDSAGNITMLDASFKQQCESPEAPALKGTVKYHAPPLSFAVASIGDDPIGRGVNTKYSGSNAAFNVFGTADQVAIRILGKREFWTIIMAPPAGKKLMPGHWPVTTGTSSFDPTTAALALGHDNAVVGFGNGWGHTCSYDPDRPGTGDLTISAIEFDSEEKVTALDATYEFQCGGHTGKIQGKINYHR